MSTPIWKQLIEKLAWTLISVKFWTFVVFVWLFRMGILSEKALLISAVSFMALRSGSSLFQIYLESLGSKK